MSASGARIAAVAAPFAQGAEGSNGSVRAGPGQREGGEGPGREEIEEELAVAEWQNGNRRPNKGTGRTLRQEQTRLGPMVYEEREGD